MQIYLIFDYGDKCIEATCDGQKASEMVDAYNGPGCNFPYYLIPIELQDVPQQAHAADAESQAADDLLHVREDLRN